MVQVKLRADWMMIKSCLNRWIKKYEQAPQCIYLTVFLGAFDILFPYGVPFIQARNIMSITCSLWENADIKPYVYVFQQKPKHVINMQRFSGLGEEEDENIQQEYRVHVLWQLLLEMEIVMELCTFLLAVAFYDQ